MICVCLHYLARCEIRIIVFLIKNVCLVYYRSPPEEIRKNLTINTFTMTIWIENPTMKESGTIYPYMHLLSSYSADLPACGFYHFPQAHIVITFRGGEL